MTLPNFPFYTECDRVTSHFKRPSLGRSRLCPLTQLKHLGEALLDFTLEGILNTNPNRVDLELVKVMQQVAEVVEERSDRIVKL